MSRTLIVAAVLASGLATAQPRPPSYYLEALSTDGKHALLQELSNDSAKIHYHVVAVDGGAIESDVTLEAIAKLPLETMNDGGGEKRGVKLDLGSAALANDLRTVSPVLSQFPLGAGNRIGARGAIVAFNVGDYIYTSKDGAIGKRLSNDASYAPWLTPDGTAIMFRKENGRFANSPIGNYELYVSPIDGRSPPARIADTSGALDGFVLSRTGSARFIANDEGANRICVVDVTLGKPYKATRKACVATGKDERLVGGSLSTHGAWAALTTTTGTGKAQRFRFRTFDVEHGKPGFDEQRILMATAINDDGLVVVDRFNATVIVDSHTKVVDQLAAPIAVMSAQFRSTTELVAEHGGTVTVFDARTWQHVPWTDANR